MGDRISTTMTRLGTRRTAPISSLPFELLRKIISGILAESIHEICVSSVLISWDENVVWMLAKTCLLWQETVRCMLVLAVVPGVVSDESDSHVLSLIHRKLMQLREFGLRSRQPTSFPSPASLMKDSGPLAQAYVLYLVAAALRSNSVRSIGQIDTAPYDHIKLALKKAVQVLAKVTPRGLALTFDKALHKEICLVNFGTVIAEACGNLKSYLSEFSSSSSAQSQHEIKTKIHKVLRPIEDNSCPSCTDLDINTPEGRRLLEVSGIVAILTRCRNLDLDIDEYELKRRVNTLIERWSQSGRAH